MNRKIYFIYDDRIRPLNNISNIIGKCKFGDILHKRVFLSEKIKLILKKVDLKIERFIVAQNDNDLQNVINLVKNVTETTSFIHFMSYAVISDEEKFILALKKSLYINRPMVTNHLHPLVYFFSDSLSYLDFLGKLNNDLLFTNELNINEDQIITPNNFVVDISNLPNFLSFFSGGFEARYFNSLKGDNFTLIKTSTDKIKIKKEHDYYHLLPNEMKGWFVTPYDLVINESGASYSMERLNIPDMALQWIHGSILSSDLNIFLDKIFFFINSRPKRKINKDKYMKRFTNLYYLKILERIKNLKERPEYAKINLLIKGGTNYKTIDDILKKYEELYRKVSINEIDFSEVIGHGDLCFSNILYDKNSNIMKFIDPKGALNEEELWVDPYYDLAKLSHSIFGCYDYINNEMFSVVLNSECKMELNIECPDISGYQKIFFDKLLSYNFDIFRIRLCETSLFLSMLPLHIENLRKVFGFILNAINILEELEQNVDM
jgi:hypothetical protein